MKFEPKFDSGVCFSLVSTSDLGELRLHAEEASILDSRASLKRRREFLLGRVAARKSLEKLGITPVPPILKGKNREPLWPSGVVGAISHSGDYAVAMTAHSPPCQAVGIDLQNLGEERRYDIAKFVCTSDELYRLSLHPDSRSELLLHIFSVKETIFKALHPLVQLPIRFSDAELNWDKKLHIFTARLTRTLTEEFPAGYVLTVKCLKDNNFCLSYVVLK